MLNSPPFWNFLALWIVNHSVKGTNSQQIPVFIVRMLQTQMMGIMDTLGSLAYGQLHAKAFGVLVDRLCQNMEDSRPCREKMVKLAKL